MDFNLNLSHCRGRSNLLVNKINYMHNSVIYIIYNRHYRVALLFILSLSFSFSSYLILSLCYSRYFECDQSPRVCVQLQSQTRPKLGRRNALSLFRCMNWRGTFAECYVNHRREIVNRPCGKCTAHYRFIIIVHDAGGMSTYFEKWDELNPRISYKIVQLYTMMFPFGLFESIVGREI